MPVLVSVLFQSALYLTKLSNFHVCSHFNFTPSRMVILAQNSWCFSPFVAIYFLGVRHWWEPVRVRGTVIKDFRGIEGGLSRNSSGTSAKRVVFACHNPWCPRQPQQQQQQQQKKKMQNRFDQLARWALFGSKRYSTYLSNLILSNLSYNPRRFGMVTYRSGDKCVQNRHFSPTKTSNIIDVSSI